MSPRARRVMAAVGFNLLFEYSMRGVNDLASHPGLALFLFLLYCPYFALLDDFVTRTRASATAVAAVGFGFGSLAALFLPGSMFKPTGFLGINWGAFLFVNLVWWATLQGVLTMYAAARLVPRRQDEVPLTRGQRLLTLLWLIVVLFLFRGAIRAPGPARPAGGIVLIFGIAALALAHFLARRQPREATADVRIWWLDLLLLATVAVFLFAMLALTHDPTQISIHRVNLSAVRLVVGWTSFLFLSVLVATLLRPQRIPV